MNRFIISIAAEDHPGIVAGVGEGVLELNGNIEAASQTVHQGYFAMILLCRFPQEQEIDGICKAIKKAAGSDLNVFITPYNSKIKSLPISTQSFIVTSIGPDQPGILEAITSYLASKNINIDDLYAKIHDKDFIVICQVAVPEELDVYMIQADLEAIGEKEGLCVQMQHENVFVATNDLRFGRIK